MKFNAKNDTSFDYLKSLSRRDLISWVITHYRLSELSRNMLERFYDVISEKGQGEK